MSEMMNYVYRTRELQVAAITQQADASLGQELQELWVTHPNSRTALDLLLSTPPIVLPQVMRDVADSKEDFFNLVYPTALIIAKSSFVLSNLKRLLTACSADNRGFREALIGYRISPSFKAAFEADPDMLMDIVGKSYLQGTAALLAAVQGDVLLIGYRRDLAEGRISLAQSVDGGAIGYLETKIPSVNLKLWYPQASSLPKLSFAVDDINGVVV